MLPCKISLGVTYNQRRLLPRSLQKKPKILLLWSVCDGRNSTTNMGIFLAVPDHLQRSVVAFVSMQRPRPCKSISSVCRRQQNDAIYRPLLGEYGVLVDTQPYLHILATLHTRLEMVPLATPHSAIRGLSLISFQDCIFRQYLQEQDQPRSAKGTRLGQPFHLCRMVLIISSLEHGWD